MKDSGVEWIGKIPKDWKVIKNKNCFELEKNIVGSSFENYQLLSSIKFLHQNHSLQLPLLKYVPLYQT